jgi:hypothetical protein
VVSSLRREAEIGAASDSCDLFEMSEERCMSVAKQLTVADCQFDKQPKCAHCDARFPKLSKVERSADPHFIVVKCACGCITPFKVKNW